MVAASAYEARMALTANAGERSAIVAMARATAFLREQGVRPWLAEPRPFSSPAVRSRLIGNWLGELDRLLHVLIDSRLNTHAAWPSPSTRNTVKKVHAASADAEWSHPYLLGLSRAFSAFRFTQGRAMRADERHGTTVTLGWLAENAAWQQVSIGEDVPFDGAVLGQICAFYDRLAHDFSRTLPAGARATSGNASVTLRQNHDHTRPSATMVHPR